MSHGLYEAQGGIAPMRKEETQDGFYGTTPGRLVWTQAGAL